MRVNVDVLTRAAEAAGFAAVPDCDDAAPIVETPRSMKLGTLPSPDIPADRPTVRPVPQSTALAPAPVRYVSTSLATGAAAMDLAARASNSVSGWLARRATA